MTTRETLTDEGVPFEYHVENDVTVVVNTSTDIRTTRLQELRIDKRPYQHVGQNGAGQWIYRFDR